MNAGHRSFERGFTLVEVLLVVFIAGLSASIIVMTLPNGPERLEREAGRVELALETLQERSVVTGQVHGVELFVDRFEVVRRSDGDWQGDRSLGMDLSAPIEFVVQRRRGEEGPHFFLDPSGAPTDVELVLTDGRRSLALAFGAPNEDQVRR